MHAPKSKHRKQTQNSAKMKRSNAGSCKDGPQSGGRGGKQKAGRCRQLFFCDEHSDRDDDVNEGEDYAD